MSDALWDRVVGQADAVTQLRNALTHGAAGRSYLFAGARGVGRDLAARIFAASLLCDDGGCGTCRTCARILDSDTIRHVDVTTVAPEGALILVEQIRELRALAARSPIEASAKVLIIQQAETMNPSSANALLKVLEEPPRDTVFILITERPEELPDTIVSRCRRIDFAPLPPRIIRSLLTEREGASSDVAEWAARTGTDLATALRFIRDPDARDRRRRHLEIPSRIVRGGLPAIVTVAGEIVTDAASRRTQREKEHEAAEKDLADSLGEARGSTGAITRLRARHKREQRAEELRSIDSALRDLASFYRDCLVASSGAGSETWINREDSDRIERGASAVDAGWLADAVNAVEERRRMLQRNVQPRLALESLFAMLQTPRPRRS